MTAAASPEQFKFSSLSSETKIFRTTRICSRLGHIAKHLSMATHSIIFITLIVLFQASCCNGSHLPFGAMGLPKSVSQYEHQLGVNDNQLPVSCPACLCRCYDENLDSDLAYRGARARARVRRKRTTSATQSASASTMRCPRLTQLMCYQRPRFALSSYDQKILAQGPPPAPPPSAAPSAPTSQSSAVWPAPFPLPLPCSASSDADRAGGAQYVYPYPRGRGSYSPSTAPTASSSVARPAPGAASNRFFPPAPFIAWQARRKTAGADTVGNVLRAA